MIKLRNFNGNTYFSINSVLDFLESQGVITEKAHSLICFEVLKQRTERLLQKFKRGEVLISDFLIPNQAVEAKDNNADVWINFCASDMVFNIIKSKLSKNIREEKVKILGWAYSICDNSIGDNLEVIYHFKDKPIEMPNKDCDIYKILPSEKVKLNNNTL